MELKDLKDYNVIETRNGSFYLVRILLERFLNKYILLKREKGEENYPFGNFFFEEPLANDLTCSINSDYDVVRVYQDFTLKELLWERPNPLLTEVEKTYIKNLVAPFVNQVEFLIKQKEW